MPTPNFVSELLGYRLTKQGAKTSKVNISDASSSASAAISEHILEATVAGEPRLVPYTEGTGTRFEVAVRAFLAQQLRTLDPDREWLIGCESIHRFRQYEHLDNLQRLIDEDDSGLLAISLGGDYIIRPDVTIGIPGPNGNLFLHAAVSCKWTLRSDRAQNVRHEANTMVRHRRGRLPHIVAVTMEPFPGRLASLARGTGDVDAVYHAAYDELLEAVLSRELASKEQRTILQELVNQRRLRDLAELPQQLVL